MAVIAVTGLRYNATAYHVGDDFFYYIKKEHHHRVHLQCVKRACPGRANMPSALQFQTVDNFVVSVGHDHGPDPAWLELELTRQTIMQRCVVEATLFHQIWREETGRLRVDVAARLPYNSLTSAMGVARRSARGPTPQTLAQYGEAMEANPQLGFDGDGGEFYRQTLVDGSGGTAVIFVSSTLSERFHDCTHVHVDATFKVVPRVPPAYQLLTLSSIYFDHVEGDDGPEDEAPGDRPPGTCVVCLAARASHIFIPCGHRCVCAVCADSLRHHNRANRCPACRTVSQGIFATFDV